MRVEQVSMEQIREALGLYLDPGILATIINATGRTVRIEMGPSGFEVVVPSVATALNTQRRKASA